VTVYPQEVRDLQAETKRRPYGSLRACVASLGASGLQWLWKNGTTREGERARAGASGAGGAGEAERAEALDGSDFTLIVKRGIAVKKKNRRRSTKRRSFVADIEGGITKAKDAATTRPMTDVERAEHFPNPKHWLDRRRQR
jgi:hypothetical protein